MAITVNTEDKSESEMKTWKTYKSDFDSAGDLGTYSLIVFIHFLLSTLQLWNGEIIILLPWYFLGIINVFSRSKNSL